ncbi:MAG: hypothetical protein CME68_03120 [Halobacteriovoraceae bacterium]|nr:hypothetical protein [Halobacteriovoraceae bacterium]
MTLEELEKIIKKTNLFDPYLGIVREIKNNKIFQKLKVEEKHLGAPNTCHGGMLASLMDSVLGLTTWVDSVPKGFYCSTVEFKINYLNRAMLGDTIIGEGTIVDRGNSLVVTEGKIYCEEKDLLICKGIGTFNLYPKKN